VSDFPPDETPPEPPREVDAEPPTLDAARAAWAEAARAPGQTLLGSLNLVGVEGRTLVLSGNALALEVLEDAHRLAQATAAAAKALGRTVALRFVPEGEAPAPASPPSPESEPAPAPASGTGPAPSVPPAPAPSATARAGETPPPRRRDDDEASARLDPAVTMAERTFNGLFAGIDRGHA
jgi:hypothetical protein